MLPGEKKASIRNTKIVGIMTEKGVHMKDKFTLSEDTGLDERFTSAASRKDHFYRHYSETSAKPEELRDYEQQADELALRPVDYRNIFGYEIDLSMNKKSKGYGRRFAKYNKATELFVVYAGVDLAGEPIVISAYPMSWREYNSKRAINYLGEIPIPEYQRDWDFRYNPRSELVEV